MTVHKTISHNETQTMRLGERVASQLKPGDIILLCGELGSGKTTFVKGIARGLRINPRRVNSPTFVLLNIYEGKLPLFHFDFYRLNDAQEIKTIGYDEFLYGGGVTVVEWAERLAGLMPKEYLKLQLSHRGEDERLITLCPRGKRYKQLLSGLKVVREGRT